MKKPVVLSALLALPLLSGCLHFVNSADVNLAVDPYFASRNFISAGKSAFAQDIAGLVGRVAYKDANGTYQFMNNPLLENSKKPKVQAVQSAYSYSSKVDKGYRSTLSLAFITPDITGKTATDYEIRDVATGTVESDGEPSRPQFEAAATAAKVPAGRPWFWVRSVVLADLRRQQSVNLDGKTTITGSGFSANGEIYNNPSASEWVPLVSVDLVPMNDLADNEVVPNPAYVPPVRGGVKSFEPQFLLKRPANVALISSTIE